MKHDAAVVDYSRSPIVDLYSYQIWIFLARFQSLKIRRTYWVPMRPSFSTRLLARTARSTWGCPCSRQAAVPRRPFHQTSRIKPLLAANSPLRPRSSTTASWFALQTWPPIVRTLFIQTENTPNADVSSLRNGSLFCAHFCRHSNSSPTLAYYLLPWHRPLSSTFLPVRL